MTYHVRMSSPTRFPAIPVPSRWSRYWSSLEAVPYQLQTWWRNAKRRWRWKSYQMVKCDSCSLWDLRYRVKPVILRDGTVEQTCTECRETAAFAILIIRHLARENQ